MNPKPTPADIERQFKDAPRLDPTGRPRNDPSAEGGRSPSAPARERLGGYTDGQVPRDKLP